MLGYLLRRVLLMTVTVLAISVLAFIIIQLPPGDYLSTVIANLQARGVPVNQEMIRSLENQYGLNLPLHAQYLKWMWNMLHGDMGRSFQWNEPVSKLIGERRLLMKYPVRMALNPIISTIGWTLPVIVSGETITAIVLSLPTTGPLLFRALLAQDMYLAGSTVMLLTVLTVLGTLVSDVMLVWATRASATRGGRAVSVARLLTRTARAARLSRTRDDESYYLSSQWQLMWRKFKRHRGAGGVGRAVRERRVRRVLRPVRHRQALPGVRVLPAAAHPLLR